MTHPRLSALLTLVAAGLALAGVACGGTFQTGPDSGGDDSATDSGEPGDGGYHNDVDNPEIGPGDGDHPDSPLPDAPSGDVGPGDTGPGDTGPGLDVVLPDVIAIDVITPFDVAAPPDATSTCSIMGGFGGGGPGTCSVGTDYTCGADTYEIECDCPSGTCTCQKDGAPIPVAVSYKGCPSCSKMPFAMVAAACGIPY